MLLFRAVYIPAARQGTLPYKCVLCVSPVDWKRRWLLLLSLQWPQVVLFQQRFPTAQQTGFSLLGFSFQHFSLSELAGVALKVWQLIVFVWWRARESAYRRSRAQWSRAHWTPLLILVSGGREGPVRGRQTHSSDRLLASFWNLKDVLWPL